MQAAPIQGGVFHPVERVNSVLRLAAKQQAVSGTRGPVDAFPKNL